MTFPSHLQYLNGSLSKTLRSLKVHFHTVNDIGLKFDSSDGSPGFCSEITVAIFHKPGNVLVVNDKLYINVSCGIISINASLNTLVLIFFVALYF